MADMTRATWHTSSYSRQAQTCVEVATNLRGSVGVLVRDTKDLGLGPVVVVGAAGWVAFTRAVRGGGLVGG